MSVLHCLLFKKTEGSKQAISDFTKKCDLKNKQSNKFNEEDSTNEKEGGRERERQTRNKCDS
jgi:hypothetical protein